MVKYFASTKALKGFTLVELSIVIVIIGLIVAGITAGKSLVNAAKLQSVVTEKGQYILAINAFRLQYNAVPGDMINAFSYWPTCGGGSASVCNGNGDTIINIGDEDYVFWEQLYLAGLISAKYSYTNSLTLGTNVAKSQKSSVVGWWVQDHAIILGSQRGDSNWFNGEALTPAEALSLDTKMDDGKARTGKVVEARDQERFNNATICIDKAYNAVDLVNAQYILTDTSISCTMAIYFR